MSRWKICSPELGKASRFETAPRLASRATKLLGVLAVSLSCLATTSAAFATPQWNAGVAAGVSGSGDRRELWQSTHFYGAAHLDVLFASDGPRDFAVGPFFDLGTAGFDDLRLAAGPSVLVPLFSSFPVVASAGGYIMPLGASSFSSGFHGTLFLGSRSYNYHAPYSPAFGLVVGLDYALDRSKETLVSAAFQLDAELLALPFLALYSALKPND